jgi:hypothetical protein
MKGYRFIWHPFLLALYLVVGAYREVKPLADPREAFMLVPVLLLVAGLMVWIFKRCIRDARKAALLATLMLFYLGLSGEIQVTCIALAKGTRFAFMAKLWIILVVLTVLTGLAGWAIARTKRDLTAHTRALHAATAALLLMGILAIWTDPRDRELQAFMKSRAESRLPAQPNPPDIYYIVLDSLTSVSGMRTYFGVDPVEMLDYLAARGFQVATHARSEFTFTELSLATSLNMHVPPRLSFGYESRYGKNALLRMMRYGVVPDMLQAAGYEMVNLGMTPLEKTPAPYALLPAVSFVTVRNSLRNRSIAMSVPFLLRRVKNNSRFQKEARLVLHPLDALETVARERSARPRFIFCHVMLPHPPFYFLHDGQVREPVWFKHGTDRDYREQLMFTTRKITQIVESILTGSDGDPVIVIQGDHGYRKLRAGGDAQEDESHSVFFAFRCPGIQREHLWEGIQSANFFRLVLNQVFQAGLPYVHSDPTEERSNASDSDL